MTLKLKTSHHLNASAAKAARALVTAMESAMSLETVSSYLKKAIATESMTPVGMRMANLAIESICSKVKTTDKLAFALENLEAGPEAVTESGLAEIDAKMESIWQAIDAALAKLMEVTAEKMSTFKGNLQAMQQAVLELSTKVGAMDPMTYSKETNLAPSAVMAQLAYSDKGFLPCADGVLDVVDNLLTVHGTAWKRTIGEQVQWLQDNSVALQNNQNVFSTLKFDPATLLILNSAVDLEGDTSAASGACELSFFLSEQLPGNCRLATALPKGPVQDMLVIDLMSNISMGFCQGAACEPCGQYNVLTVNEMKHKLSEMKNTLVKLEDWYAVIYRDIWTDQVFQLMLGKTVSHEQSENVGSRELKNFVLAVLAMMTKATEAVDDYAFQTLGATVAYVNASLEQYA